MNSWHIDSIDFFLKNISYNEYIKDINIAKLYYTVQCRNSFGEGYIINSHYDADDLYFFSLEDAKKECEKDREKGLSFSISESFSLYIESNEHIILISHNRHFNPLKYIDYIKETTLGYDIFIDKTTRKKISLYRFIQHIFMYSAFKDKYRSIVCIDLELKSKNNIEFCTNWNNYKEFSSKSIGAQYYLKWDTYEYKSNDTDLMEICKHIKNIII